MKVSHEGGPGHVVHAERCAESEEHAARADEGGEHEHQCAEQPMGHPRRRSTRQRGSVEPEAAETLHRQHEPQSADGDGARTPRVERRVQGPQRHQRRALGDGTRTPRCAVDLRREDEDGAAQSEENDERARDEPAPQVDATGDAAPVDRYWITERGVGVRRVTLIFSRSIMVGTRGEISFFQ